VRSLRYFISWGLVFMVLNVITFVIAATQMWLLSPRLCLVVLALSPPLVYGAVRFNRRLHRVYWQVQQEVGELTTVVEEATAGVRVVKAFGREDQQARRLEVEASSILDQNLEAARIRAFYVPLLAILPQLCLAAILWYGGRLVIDGQVTLGALVAFNSYLLLLAWPLQGLGMLFGFAQRAAASAERVFEVLDQPPAIADRPGATPLPNPAKGSGEPQGGAPVHREGSGEPQGGAPVGLELAEALFAAFSDPAGYRLFDDARPALEALAGRGLRLGVVSNFEPWLEDVLALEGVDHLFAAVAISGKLGVAKPDPEIFLAALAEAGADPAATVHVGDQPANDVAAARAVGITPVLIDRFARHPGPDGVHRVEDLLGLVRLLNGHGSG
jgi:HAD superfamily hydrolase (TIGR01549 family)